METLSIIGGGHLGKSLGRVWAHGGILEISTVLNRSQDSSASAVAFLGQGRAISTFSELPTSDYVMISVPDDAIEVCCQTLAASQLKPGTVVFHCSGSLPSSILESAKKQGALIASLHPLHSFADSAASAARFSGTPCGIEGDPVACERLSRLVLQAGGKVFALNPETKLFYHAGTVMVCNYLTALVEAGMQCYEKAGIPRAQAMELAKPILEETLANNFRLSPTGALTGPIARGDSRLVTRQFEAMEQWNPLLSELYKAAGLVAVELARKKGLASGEALEIIQKRLGSAPEAVKT